jgi:predicted GNAT family acetyltransferase
MNGTRDDLRLDHRPERSRFEIREGDTLAGLAEYRDERKRRIFTHTEVDPSFGGRGLGSRLIRYALDETREEGRSVIPLCSFVAAYIEQHPDYQDLVAPTP